MTNYTKDELISSTTISRNFGLILNKLSTQELAKVAVIRNNKIEAVLLPIDTYEEITSISELKEHIELYKLIKSREQNSETIEFESVIQDLGISIDEL